MLGETGRHPECSLIVEDVAGRARGARRASYHPCGYAKVMRAVALSSAVMPNHFEMMIAVMGGCGAVLAALIFRNVPEVSSRLTAVIATVIEIFPSPTV